MRGDTTSHDPENCTFYTCFLSKSTFLCVFRKIYDKIMTLQKIVEKYNRRITRIEILAYVFGEPKQNGG